MESGATATKIEVHCVIILDGRNNRGYEFQEQEEVPARNALELSIKWAKISKTRKIKP